MWIATQTQGLRSRPKTMIRRTRAAAHRTGLAVHQHPRRHSLRRIKIYRLLQLLGRAPLGIRRRPPGRSSRYQKRHLRLGSVLLYIFLRSRQTLATLLIVLRGKDAVDPFFSFGRIGRMLVCGKNQLHAKSTTPRQRLPPRCLNLM